MNDYTFNDKCNFLNKDCIGLYYSLSEIKDFFRQLNPNPDKYNESDFYNWLDASIKAGFIIVEDNINKITDILIDIDLCKYSSEPEESVEEKYGSAYQKVKEVLQDVLQSSFEYHNGKTSVKVVNPINGNVIHECIKVDVNELWAFADEYHLYPVFSCKETD